VQVDATELDSECLADLGSLAESKEKLNLAVQECVELEAQAVNNKEESNRKQA
jgi:hypothetical protein